MVTGSPGLGELLARDTTPSDQSRIVPLPVASTSWIINTYPEISMPGGATSTGHDRASVDLGAQGDNLIGYCAMRVGTIANYRPDGRRFLAQYNMYLKSMKQVAGYAVC